MLDADIYRSFQKSPIAFIKHMWKLEPQPVREDRKGLVWEAINAGRYNEVQEQDFEKFIKGKHFSWQQWLFLLSIERAINKVGPNKISVVSGHGTGKSSALSWIIIWYLFCFLDAQVGATAPTSQQIHDVLWKEIALWLGKLPPEIKGLYEWTSGYLRIKERPETWFARARTAGKDNPEAMAGLHGDYVLILADEASGIDDVIYRSAEGSLTGENTLVILISNGTRSQGYFYNTHHVDKENWATMAFSSEQSPVVEPGYIERIEQLYGRESDEFKIRVAGKFPNSEQMDDQGWIPLITEREITQVSDGIPFIGERWLGVDPAGDGDDQAVWVVRDNFQARVVAKEAISTPISIALKTIHVMEEFGVPASHVYIDNLGEGANVGVELLKLNHTMWVNPVNWAEEAEDFNTFFNKRAECCLRSKEWLKRGGALVGDELKREVCGFAFKNNLRGLKQIMGKPDLKKKIGKSPDRADAFFLTFYTKPFMRVGNKEPAPFDPFAAI